MIIERDPQWSALEDCGFNIEIVRRICNKIKKTLLIYEEWRIYTKNMKTLGWFLSSEATKAGMLFI